MKVTLILAGILLVPGTAAAQDQQIGARTKAMGGSYTAFEDDPISVWLNPAGIAAQPDQLSVAYQTYTAYPVEETRASGGSTVTSVRAETSFADPEIIPSYLGSVFQLGNEENPMSIGICYARPYHLNYAMDKVIDANQPVFVPEANMEQSLSRFRAAFAYDFRIREPGEAGFLPHISLGVGADIGFVRWKFTSTDQDKTDISSSFGFGVGALVGVYDDTETIRVNFGIAYQSAIRYHFDIAPDILPAFNMPQQVNAGLTFYLLEGMPLRVTFDFQWLDWSDTAEKPLYTGNPSFEDAFNVSAGVEYRVEISEEIFFYPRAGFRVFEAPWGDKNNLPMTGAYKLVLDTKSERFNLFTFGFGVSWLTEEGRFRTIDLAMDTGGDAYNAAFGYTHEF